MEQSSLFGFIHPKIKYISVSGIGNAETRETLVEKKLQEAQSKKKFKDAGTRIKGSKKEKAAIRGLISVSDLSALEQDEVTAYEMVVKDKVWAKPDFDTDRQGGISAGVSFLKSELRRAYAGKPRQKTAAMRKSYVILAAYFQNHFAKIMTLDELKFFADKFYGLEAIEAVKVYLPDEAHLFELPTVAASLEKRFNKWQTRQLLKDVAGQEFYNLLFRLNSDAAVLKWKAAYKFEEKNEWSFSGKKSVQRGDQSEIKINTGLPLSYIKRIGGLAINDVSEKFIIDTLGFKYLEFGNYVRDNEANEHLRHFIGAYVDLCDILNISAKQITQLNNLSIAFGSRGKAGAMAFYQPARQIIALTKQRGDGTVAHEWFHYLDHLVYKNVSPNSSIDSLFTGHGMKIKGKQYEKLKFAFENLFTYIQKGKYLEVTAWNPGYHFSASHPVGNWITPKKDIEAETIKYTYVSQATHKYRLPLKETAEATLQNFKNSYPSYFRGNQYKSDKTKKIVGFIASHFGQATLSIEFKQEISSSLFYYYSSRMKSKYWIMPEELFARAFEVYMFDKLEKQGRYNNYLVSGGYFDSELKLYPFGKDREVLFMLFESLFSELKSALNIKPFEPFTTHRADEYINFDEKKENEVVSSGVIVETDANVRAKALALEIELELLSI